MKRGTMVALGIIVLLVAGGSWCDPCIERPWRGTTCDGDPTTRPVATGTTQGPGLTTAISTTSLPTTTQMSITTTTTPVQTITEILLTGPTGWHSGDGGIPPAGDGYRGLLLLRAAVPRRRGPERQLLVLFREHCRRDSGRGVLKIRGGGGGGGGGVCGTSPSRPSRLRWGR